MMDSMDEAKLIAYAKEGDLDAFNRLVLAYQSHVYSITYRVMGDADSAADAAQDTMIIAYRKINSHRGGSFKAWLSRIATNLCIDELRRRKRHPLTSLDDEPDYDDAAEYIGAVSAQSNDPGPEEVTETDEISRALEDCIRRLPVDFRMALVLIDVEGYDYKQAAVYTGKSIGTVKSRLSRGRARMRDCMQRYRELLPAAFRQQNEARL